jgi:diaminopimelate epimerase
VAGRDRLLLQTPTSLVEAHRVGEDFSVDMGPPALDWQAIPLARDAGDTRAIDFSFGPAGAPILTTPGVVNMGNPHVVFWVDRDPQSFDLQAIGPRIEHDPLFPERVNVSLAQVLSPDHIMLRVWERGAGITRACGSGACATAVAAARLGKTGRKVRVTLPGGDLLIEWRESDGHVLMTGAAELEHQGRFSADWFADAA